MKLLTMLFEDIEDHLRSRGLDPKKTQVIMDKETGKATFLLYNLSGQLVGYQRYNPAGTKTKNNDPVLGKYFIYVTKESEKSSKIAVWGMETVYEHSKIVFVVEGIFDAIKIHNAGYPAVAVLSNNPKILKSWFTILGKASIAILDNDKAGSTLKNVTNRYVVVPDPYKDLGDMPQEEVTQFIKQILK